MPFFQVWARCMPNVTSDCHQGVYYLMILFRERGRKSALAPGGVALIDARFGVALLRSTPVSPSRICAYAHAIYSLIRE